MLCDGQMITLATDSKFCRGIKPIKSGAMGITINITSSSGALGNVEYPLIAFIPKSKVEVLDMVPFMDQIDSFENYLYLMGILDGPPHMAEQKQDNQLEHTYSSYVRIWDVALKTCLRR